ncbi:MAG: hypothetical protein ACXADY_01985 [Candidatus Hodarchaeales archaeon]|jgi:hypothetical protein
MKDELEFFSDFYECSFQLVPFSKGTDLLEDIFDQIEVQIKSIYQLLHWKRKHLLFPKPTLSTDQIFVFWVHSSIVDSALLLTGVRGGFKVTQKEPNLPDSSTYKGKKQTPRPRRVLLDIGCDDPALIKALTQLNLEVELVWRHAADLLNYEIIQICTDQYIDILVSTNSQLLTPPEEWLTYLMPHRTRLFFPTPQLLQDSGALAQAIYERAFTRLKRKQKKPYSHQFKDDPIKDVKKPLFNSKLTEGVQN